MTLFLLLVVPFAGAAAVAGLRNDARNLSATLAGATTIAALALLGSLGPDVFAGDVVRISLPWMEAAGLALSLRVDGLAWAFGMLVLAIGALVVLYARYYLSDEDPIARFFAFLLLFMGAMLGVVLAGNLLLLAVFWELTSIASFLLIGYWKHRADARQGARMALTITGAGGLCLLAGVLLLGGIAGSYELDVVLAAGVQVRAHPLYVPSLVLILIGAFAKSAQFPFHFWLPHAMAAPTPVSAYLHSATMVKAGVFLLARLHPALAGSEPWFWIVSSVGLATLLAGAWFALYQHDLKGLLAYSTISHLGLITLLFGLNSPLAAVAGVFHTLNHATFKASLFMAAGIIDHECGTRDMRRLNGLWAYMPYTATLAMTAAAAMAGVPLLNGFLSKEMFFGETLFVGAHRLLQFFTPAAATLAGVFSVAYSMRFIHDVFFNGEPVGLDRKPHEPPRWMKMPVEVLVLVCLAVGIFPQQTVGPLLALAARPVVGGALPEYSLAIWHGFNMPLLMSLIALTGGVSLYFGLLRLLYLHTMEEAGRGGRQVFDWLLMRLLGLARAVTIALENGSLQRYLLLLVGSALVAGTAPFLAGGRVAGPVPTSAVTPAGLAAWTTLVLATAATVVYYRQRLIALVMLGVVGLCVSLAFVYFSAPDLALTQLLVEVVSIILMMLALYYLPRTSAVEGRPARQWRDGAVAVAAGAGVAALAYAVFTRPMDSIAGFFLEKSVAEGGGTNAVNVIIVDFRAYDTLGEITVFGIAALAIHALVREFRAAAPLPDALPLAADRHPLLLTVVARLLLPLAAAVSLYLFLRGHNLPGGGFIAGLVLAVAMILQYIASGSRWVEARLSVDGHRWVGAGLLIAGLTGIGGWAFNHPFLTSSFLHPVLPLIGEVPIASAMFFDLGVYLTVVGGTMLMLAMLGRIHAPEPEETA